MFEPKLNTTSLSLCRRVTTSVRVRVVCIAEQDCTNTRLMWWLLALAAAHPASPHMMLCPLLVAAASS
eukprot:scaffold63508_cov39-Phaeocystis_antarctica.AAC.1